MITLYHAQLARSIRVRWLLEELGLPHQLSTLGISETHRPEFAQALPLARVPVLLDGELRLCESGAIVQYLLDTYGHGRLEPARHSKERGAYLQWLHFAEGALGVPLGIVGRELRRRANVRDVARLLEAKREAARALAVLEPALEGREWLLEQFSAADIMMSWSVFSADRYLLLASGDFPSVKKYATRIHNRPLFRRSLGP